MNFSAQLGHNSIIRLVQESAADLGLETYLIGGYVRDLLLKRDSKDLDFVCVGSGISLAMQVAEKAGLKGKVTIFKHFGTAMVHIDGLDVEFVGARRESYRSDSRKPLVEDGTLEDDQNRRDFTINALAISMNSANFGELIDPFGGVEDLRKKIIRTPLDADITFSDDPLRMMRAVRFASQLGFDIEPDTFEAIKRNAERLKIISQERTTEELNKIILSQTPSYGFKLLFHSDLLHQFFPEMVALQGVDTINGNTHKDNFYHTLQVLDNVAKVSSDLWLRWAAILHDIAKPPTKRYDPKVGWTFHGHEDKGARMVPSLFRRLKLPLNEPMRFVQNLVRMHLRPIALVKDVVTDAAIRRVLFEAGEDIDALMQLCRADITSKDHSRVSRYLTNFDRVEAKMKEVEERDQLRNFQPPISGEDIMGYFQLKPGKEVGEIKEAIREAIIEGIIPNEREKAFQLMIQVGQQKGLVFNSNYDEKK
ncbi:HD domain-containing protein [Cytophagales bacterium LB-30]|uniref:HD domain-containing protein n=1 Tax=Shiella aurantiaca TaxID=3058365 RepID=A0ABT8F488_9BACT|nr:HD domain-containing protein [Shiella aurantiaca]MDN4165265.1 HD domain-containing protein [Shiella aurantiaca]